MQVLIRAGERLIGFSRSRDLGQLGGQFAHIFVNEDSRIGQRRGNLLLVGLPPRGRRSYRRFGSLLDLPQVSP